MPDPATAEPLPPKKIPPLQGHRPAETLAWSETRLERIEAGKPVFAPWLPSGLTAAVGISQTPDRELYVDTLRQEGVTLLRRQSGGGAVLLHPGVLCWESMADIQDIERLGGKGADIRQSYAVLCQPVLTALRSLGVDAFQAGICDISVRVDAIDGDIRKVAGTAQLRRRSKVLVHGSLLVSPDLPLMERCLRFPSEQPDYRQGRSHSDFCLGIAQLIASTANREGEPPPLPHHIARLACQAALDAGWQTEQPAIPTGDEEFAAAKIKYNSPEWNWDKKRIQK